jgi:transposase InsO family protein
MLAFEGGRAMPWQEHSVTDLRREFVTLASHPEANLRELCRRFQISPKTGYKWLARWQADGVAGLADRSRRPHTSPRQTAPDLEAAVVALREAHPAWGGRKLHHRLRAQGMAAVPAPSTITDILHRHALIDQAATTAHVWQRFEHAAPNDLWQLDFMGHLALDRGRVHPLTLVDDHSRFALGFAACANEQAVTVRTQLERAFRRYGLPKALLADNGPPWSTSGKGGLTALEAWLIRLGIAVWHGQPYHPQTQGKVERLHGTLAREVFRALSLATLNSAQRALDRFRTVYNHERPHEALAYATPASRYTPSPRGFPDQLPAVTYDPTDAFRKVRDQGAIGFANRSWFVSRGLIGEHVAVRPTTTDGVFAVLYVHHQVATIDLRTHP